MKSIGSFTPVSPFFLAPMAGFTDSTYRTICSKMGAALTYTEMVSAKGLYYKDKKTPELLLIGEDEYEVGFQIFGSEPEIMGFAAKNLNKEKNVILDVNMGCPVPKVVKNGEGSALLKDPELIYRIIRSLKENTDKPVTAKIRIGISGAGDDAGISAAQAVESAGGDGITVHGRTREQYYSGEVDLEYIKKIKDAVTIPVTGNGDIASYQDAMEMMERTGCDFVMIGRSALGNPWIFRELNAAYMGNPIPERPSNDEICECIIRHYLNMEALKGEYTAVREMRKFIPKYLKGLPGSARIRGKVNNIVSGSELCSIIEEELCQRKDLQ